MPIQVTERGVNPFDMSGIVTGKDGIRRYESLPRSLVEMLSTRVAQHPAAEALAEVDGRRLTYQQLWDEASAVAGGLAAGGVSPGDRVAIFLPSGIDWVLGFLGTLLAGATAVPINTRLSEPEVQSILDDCKPGMVFRPTEPLPVGELTEVASPDHTDVAAIFYTSGTTGEPKGALQTHEGLLSNAETAVRAFDLDRNLPPAGLRTLISVPLFHVTGCHSQLLVALYLSGTAVILPALDVPRIITVVAEERINLMITVPAIYKLTITHDSYTPAAVESVRWVGYGGAPTSPELVREIQEAFPSARVFNGFGSTESSSLTSALPDEFAVDHVDSVGFAVPVIDLALDALDDRTGVGELLVRGPNVVPGYWNKPEKTAETIQDGWLHTGDLARIEDGLIYLADRIKDVVNRGGEKVFCIEVENALAGLGGVVESAVIGVPDSVMGEKVGAVVVTAETSPITADDIKAFLHDKVADYKVPEYVLVRSEPLPRNAGGKLRKPDLRATVEWGVPLR